jgi:hypothetical protein
MTDPTTQREQTLVGTAVERAVTQYIEARKARIPDFVERHFSFRPALRLNRKAFGADLLKGPLNIAWALPYTLSRVSSGALRKAGEGKLSSFLDRLPRGFETDVQREVAWLIYTDLLELPYRQGERSSDKDALLEQILAQPELAERIEEYLSEISERSTNPRFRSVLERQLREYASSRTSTAELAGSVLSLASNFVAFKQAAPGGLAGGTLVANAIAQHLAISQFWLGATLGTWYYGLFPAAASTGLLLASIGTVMAALALATSFAGILTDPLQARLGIHQRRLRKLVDSVEQALAGSTEPRLNLKEQYIARVFDILDLLKAAATAA